MNALKTKQILFVSDFTSFICIFAGRPFALQNCTVSNQSIDSIHVECIESFDGGLPQMFLLEMVEIPTLKLVRNLTLFVSINVTSSFPIFVLWFSTYVSMIMSMISTCKYLINFFHSHIHRDHQCPLCWTISRQQHHID